MKASHRINHIYPIKKKNQNFPPETNTGCYPIKARTIVSQGTRIFINKVKGALKAAKMRPGPKEPNP